MTNEFSESLEKKLEETTKLGLEVVKEATEDRLMKLSVGPQHPGSGHFRFTIKVDGDYIVYCDPDPGMYTEERKKCANIVTSFKIFLTLSDL